MKKLLLILLFLGIWSKSHSQIITQTYIDRCTNVVYTFTVVPNGQSVVTFYNRSQVFTATQFTNGTLQAWLEETYQWWSTLNPCSAAQAESTTTQQTAQQTTQAATQAATNAASAAPPPPPPPPPATNTTTNTSTNATSSTSNTASGSGTDSTDSAQSTDSSSSSSSQSSQGETSDSTTGGETSETTGGGESDNSEGGGTEETKTEETKSEEKTESEEKVEEEKKEESKEEEKKEEENKEEESEEESEESSEEKEEEEKKEEDKKKEKKKSLAPPILAANLMSMQMLDGTWSTAASFGISQSSLTGQETYGANAMIWANLDQFSLALSKSKVNFWSNYEGIAYTVNPISGKKTPAINPDTKKRYIDRQNQIHHVGTTTVNYMYLFGTNVITAGYSHVILGQEDNFWQGFAGGYAAMGSLIVLPESLLLSPSLTFFGTKPVTFKALPRWNFGPMVAVSLSPLQLNNQEQKVNVVWNEYFTYIIGTNVNFNLTQRFGANLGINTINNTNPIIPTTFALTIGARFAF